MSGSYGRVIVKVQGWVALSRPAFHTVGILPFILGTLLAYRLVGVFDFERFALGTVGVILILLSTYHAGEYFDHAGDVISMELHANRFAGGSRMVPCHRMNPLVPLWTSITSFLLAVLVGVTLQFIYKTGPWTLVLGAIGALAGFFYSSEPIRLVKRGWGEVFIAFCFGWLPVATAYYLQTSDVAPVIHWIWVPIGSSIFNVILLNEIPDYEADLQTAKRNLLLRIGLVRGVRLYNAINAVTVIGVCLSPLVGVPARVIGYFLPFAVMVFFVSWEMVRGRYRDSRRLELLCGLNIAINLGTTGSYILAYL